MTKRVFAVTERFRHDRYVCRSPLNARLDRAGVVLEDDFGAEFLTIPRESWRCMVEAFGMPPVTGTKSIPK